MIGVSPHMGQVGGGPKSSSPSKSPTRLLRLPNYRRLWVGWMAFALGGPLGGIVIIWLAYAATYSAVWIAIIGIAQFVPTLALGIVAGVLIDRWDRRRLMIACNAANAVAMAFLAAFVWTHGVNLPVLIGAAFVTASFNTILRPAVDATIPRVLGPQDLTDGNGLMQSGASIASVVGISSAGLLIVSIGPTVGLALNAATYAIGAAMIFQMVIPAAPREGPATAEQRWSLLGEVKDGFRYLRSKIDLLTLTLSGMGVSFFYTIPYDFVVFYAGEHLHAGALGYAVLVAATTAGWGIGGLLPGRLNTERSPGLWILASGVLAGSTVIVMAFTPSLWGAVALSLLLGTVLSVGGVVFLTGVQRAVPDEYLGRYLSIDQAGGYALVPAAEVVGALAVLRFGISWCYAFSGVGLVICSLPLATKAVRNWRPGSKRIAPAPLDGDREGLK